MQYLPAGRTRFLKKKKNVKFGTFAKVICDFCQGKGYAMKGYF